MAKKSKIEGRAVGTMKREAFWKITLKGIGYVVFGNVLCVVMTMAVFMFGSNFFTKTVSIVCGVVIFYSLIFTAGWKNGVGERSLVKHGRVNSEKKYRWIAAGLIMFAFAAAPSVILLINKLFFPDGDFLLVYQFVSGSAYPFVMTFVPAPNAGNAVNGVINRITDLSALFPAMMILYYALIPAAAQLGFWCGYNDKLNADKIVYK